MTITEAPPRVDPRTMLRHVAEFAVNMGALTPDPIADRLGRANPAMVAGINECARQLRPVSVWTVTDHEQMQDAFGSLCGVVAELAALEQDRDGYLDGLGRPQTTEMADVVRGTLLADREHWLARLLDLA